MLQALNDEEYTEKINRLTKYTMMLSTIIMFGTYALYISYSNLFWLICSNISGLIVYRYLHKVHHVNISLLLIYPITAIYVENKADIWFTYSVSDIAFKAYFVYMVNERTNRVAMDIFNDRNIISDHQTRVLQNNPDLYDKYRIYLFQRFYPIKSNILSYFGHKQEISVVSVLFIDLVNYSNMSKEMNLDDMYVLLEHLYTEFDRIVSTYPECQKHEMIADCYIIISDENNVTSLVKLAFELIAVTNRLTMHIRGGIHVGAVVGGILSNNIPKFTYIGNTMNMAARLQSTSEYDSVHVTDETFSLLELDPKWTIKRCDNVYLKNIGTFTTYMLKNNIGEQ
jgi:class 3 adenylate cyclase